MVLAAQNVAFSTDNPVFSAANVGDVIRIGGGIANVVQFVSPTQFLAAVVSPIMQTIPNDPNNLPVPAPPGQWTITTPVSTISNLFHLEGMQVAVLADGDVVAGGDKPLLTVVGGAVTLPVSASNIKVGLPFVVQVQAMHAESQETMQGRQKKITGGTIRTEASRGYQVGADQPVASTLPYQQELPWKDMQDVPDYASENVPAAAIPLFTGDKKVPINGDYQNWNGYEPSPGMMCAQQLNPLPLNVLAMIPTIEQMEPNTAP